MTLEAGSRLGPYQVVAPLGSGGMGEVYRAWDARLERHVAIKILPERLASDEAARTRFEAEARSLAALSHPNILALHDFGNDAGRSFAVMELLEGRTLRDQLANGPLPWRHVAEIAAAIADGLSAAHAKGIVHRDLKPENVFITVDGRVKILDFGLARHRSLRPASDAEPTATAHTAPGTVLGTVGYMSPEQVRGEAVGAASDIFALGCVIYEMLSGRRAFAGDSPSLRLVAILESEPPPLAELAEAVPSELDRLTMLCLRKAPADRLQGAHDLALGLKALLGAGAGQERARRRARLDSIAVLPFVNEGGGADLDYLSDGLTESLIYGLSRLPRLRVLARSTAFRYRAPDLDVQRAGRELNVDAVVSGRVRHRGDAVSVRAELTDVRGGWQLWGQQFDRPVADFLGIEREAVGQISARLRPRQGSEGRTAISAHSTDSKEAFHLYLKGRHFWNKRTEQDLRKGIEYFRQAMDVDPSYALAHVGVADCLAMLGFYGALAPQDAFPKVKASASRALEIDPGLGEAHSSLAIARSYGDWDWAGAESSFRRALELSPNFSTAHHWYGNFLVLCGRFEEGIREVERALEIDPLSLIISAGLGWVEYLARRYDATIEHCRRTLDVEPGFPQAHLWLGWACEQKGLLEPAAAEFEAASTALVGRVQMLSALGHVHACAGRHADARLILHELEGIAASRYVSRYEVALVHLGLGEHDRALELLEMAYLERAVGMTFMGVEPRLDPLRPTAAFADLRRRVGI